MFTKAINSSKVGLIRMPTSTTRALFLSKRLFASATHTRAFSVRAKAECISAKKVALSICVSTALCTAYNVQAAESPQTQLEHYFENFKMLSQSENWKEILIQGEVALSIAKAAHLQKNEAKICAQLASTSFYMGDYKKALEYTNRCHVLASKFDNPSLLIRALYLESAIYRAMAPKEKDRDSQQMFFVHAVATCKKALDLVSDRTNKYLIGKVYFNLGAAHADNPEGDLNEAENCYSEAVNCFKEVEATQDFVRTSLRLGKVCLLRGTFVHTKEILDEVRPLITSRRISMQADYLEVQYLIATKEFVRASLLIQEGLRKASELGATEDHKRFLELQEKLALLT